MSNLVTRTITGVVFISAIILSVLYSPLSFGTLFLIFSIFGILEFYKLINKNGVSPLWWMGVISGTLIYLLLLLYFLHYLPSQILLIIPAIFFVLFFAELYRKKENPLQNLSYSLMGIMYIIFPFAMLISLFYPGLHLDKVNHNILLGYFIMVWINDTMAYVSGSLWGKHRLFERISPKKSWEGSIVGAIFCLGGAYVFSLFFTEMSIWLWMTMAAIIIVSATLGDLVESMFKRNLQVKDSGNFFPGHGGVLDRFDAILGSVPFVFVFIHIIFW